MLVLLLYFTHSQRPSHLCDSGMQYTENLGRFTPAQSSALGSRSFVQVSILVLCGVNCLHHLKLNLYFIELLIVYCLYCVNRHWF